MSPANFGSTYFNSCDACAFPSRIGLNLTPVCLNLSLSLFLSISWESRRSLSSLVWNISRCLAIVLIIFLPLVNNSLILCTPDSRDSSTLRLVAVAQVTYPYNSVSNTGAGRQQGEITSRSSACLKVRPYSGFYRTTPRKLFCCPSRQTGGSGRWFDDKTIFIAIILARACDTFCRCWPSEGEIAPWIVAHICSCNVLT